MNKVMKILQWNGRFISKYPPQANGKMLRIQNHLGHISLMFYYSILLYSCFFNIVSYLTLSLELIAHFVNIQRGINRKTILETQTTIDPLNEIV
jgi:hypothetical protein